MMNTSSKIISLSLGYLLFYHLTLEGQGGKINEQYDGCDPFLESFISAIVNQIYKVVD